MRHLSRTFRIFVSSTFSDLKAERDALQEEVFPKLRCLCAKHGCRFQAIDLRWGVGREAALDQRAMEICLEEVNRCLRTTPRPNFILLLGDRYGWCPPPATVAAADFARLLKQASPAEQALLAWNETQAAATKGWYRRDENAGGARAGEPDRGAFVLQPRTGRYTEDAVWEPIERQLHQLFARVFKPGAADAAGESLRYTASATEQEFARSALAKDNSDHVFAFFRRITNPERLATDAVSQPVAHDFLDFNEAGRPNPAAVARLDNLKREILGRLGGNVHDKYRAAWTGQGLTCDHLPQFCQDVHDSLAAVIEKEISTIQAVSPLEQEIREHAAFAQDRARPEIFVGRDGVLQEINLYFEGPGREPLAITGPAGVGKSALLAHTFQTVETGRPGRVVVARFIGATADSSDIRSLLENVCEQIATTYGDLRPVPKDYVALVENLPERLALATGTRPIVVILDGLNQLSENENAHRLDWLPSKLPPHVKLLVSATLGPSAGRLQELLPDGQVIGLDGLSTGEGTTLLDRWLGCAQRTLQPRQREMILSRFERHRLPLFLKLAFEQGRRWHSYDPVAPLAGEVDGLLQDFFGQLENPSSHGPMLIRRGLGLLAAARHGLSEDEMLDLLSADSELLAHIRSRSEKSPVVTRMPVVIWSRVFFDLEMYLATRSAGGTILITFHSDAVRAAVEARYLASSADALGRHRTLAAYFRLEADPGSAGQWSGTLPRGFAELAFHLRQCARRDGVTGPIYALAEDQRFRARQFEVTRKIELVRECLQLAVDSATAAHDPVGTVWMAQAHARLNSGMARTFFYQLYALAKTDPEFARSVAENFPAAGSRSLAQLFVAWICYDQPAARPLARRLVAQLVSGGTVVAAGQVTIFIWIMRDLMRAGLEEAVGLAGLIPECPLRRVCQEAWKTADGCERQLAIAFAKSQAQTVSNEDWNLAMKISRFMTISERRGAFQRNPNGLEEQCAFRFGMDSVGTGWACDAANRLVNGHHEESRSVLNRSLYVGSGTFLVQTCQRTQMAMIQALMAQGEQDLAREYRDRITTAFTTRMRLIQDKRLYWEAALVFADLEPWHTEQFLPNPYFQKYWRQVKRALSAEPELMEARLNSRLHRAGGLAAAGGQTDIAQALAEVISALVPGLAQKDCLAARVAVAALARALKTAAPAGNEAELGSASLRVAALWEPLVEGQELTLEQQRVFDALLQGPSSALAAVALALRLEGRKGALYALVNYAVRRNATAESLDAIVAQIPLLPGSDRAVLRQISTALDRMDRRFGVSSGLGFYYFTGPWQYLMGAGALLVGMGWSARGAWETAVALIGGIVLGAFYDLWLWRQWGLWKRPEQSRRFGLTTGTMFGVWTTLMYLYTDPTPMPWPDATGYAFVVALSAGILGFFCLGWLVWWRGTVVPRNLSLVAGMAIGLGASIAPFSPALARSFGAEAFGGVVLAGAVLLASGLNMLVKYVRVRRFFNGAGIRLDNSPEADAFSPFRAAVPERNETRLVKSLLRGNRMFVRGRFAAAESAFTAIIGDPQFNEWPADRQETVYVQRGLTRRNLGKFEDALADQRAAAAISPAIPAPWMNMALVLAQDLHLYSEAHAAFTEAIMRDPGYADAFSSRGLTNEAMGDVTAARADFETALQIDPHHPDALSNLGAVLLKSGQQAAALDTFRRSVEADPQDYLNRFNYAFALARTGDESGAMSVLRKDIRALRLWRRRRMSQNSRW